MQNKLLLATLVSAIMLAGCEGDDGATGPAGPAGPQGEPGPQGEQGPAAPTAQAIDLTILHVNDHHSHILPEDFDFDVSALGLSAMTETGDAVAEVEVTYGGYASLKSLFDTISGQKEHVLKLHAGDAVTGTSFYTLFNGVTDAAVMNEVCFDAFVLGNHEFDDGDTGLANFLDALNSSACDTPTLAANVVPGADSAIAMDYIQPYAIFERGGEQIGVIGIDIAGKTKNSSQPDADTEFLDEQATAQQFIDELTAAGVNKIILLTHVGYSNDISLAQNLTGVDVIVGGDSHSLLGDSTFDDLGFNPVGDYPTMQTNADGNMVCIVQAWEYAHLLGQLDISFDADGNVTACAGYPVMPISGEYVYEFNDDEDRTLTGNDQFLVTQALTAEDEVALTVPNATTEALIAGFDAQVETLRQQVIGTNATDLCLERFPGQGRSTICDVSATYERGSDISNVIAKAFLEVTPTADIAIQNAGGVRVDLAAGDVTFDNAISLLPFSNTLVTLDMTGAQIVSVLEEALANALDNGGSTGSYPYASGLRYNIDASAAAGSRVSNVEVNARVAGDWTAIDMGATYTVVTNSFIAAGRDGYVTFGTVTDAGGATDTFTEYSQGFVDFMQSLTEANESLQRLPDAEYSTQQYIGTDSCNHSERTDCIGF